MAPASLVGGVRFGGGLGLRPGVQPVDRNTACRSTGQILRTLTPWFTPLARVKPEDLARRRGLEPLHRVRPVQSSHASAGGISPEMVIRDR